MESPHEHQQSLLLSRIITNVEKLNESIVVLNRSLQQEINVQNMNVELVAQMFKNYQSNVLFHLEGSVTGEQVPQVYIGPPPHANTTYPDVQFAAIALVGFDNVDIGVGESVRIQIGVLKKELSFYDVGNSSLVLATEVSINITSVMEPSMIDFDGPPSSPFVTEVETTSRRPSRQWQAAEGRSIIVDAENVQHASPSPAKDMVTFDEVAEDKENVPHDKPTATLKKVFASPQKPATPERVPVKLSTPEPQPAPQSERRDSIDLELMPPPPSIRKATPKKTPLNPSRSAANTPLPPSRDNSYERATPGAEQSKSAFQAGLDMRNSPIAPQDATSVDDTCFSTFSEIPDMTMFAKLGQSPAKRGDMLRTPGGKADATPRTTRKRSSPSRSPSPTPRRQRTPAAPNSDGTTSFLIDFTQQMDGVNTYRPSSPGKSATESNLLQYINNQRSPNKARQAYSTPSKPNNILHLLDFELPPAPTPRSVPTITVRELESLKSSYLSQISSLKATLSGREAEVDSLKKAVGDAERRVGEAQEAVRDERGRREHVEQEKAEWEKRGKEVEQVLNSVKEEVMKSEAEKDEMARKVEDGERRVEDAEARAVRAEERFADALAARASNAGEGDASAVEDQVQRLVAAQIDAKIEAVSRELHSVYKEKHERKVGTLKKSYEARSERKCADLQGRLAEMEKRNDELMAAKDSTFSGPVTDSAAADAELKAQLEEQKAALARLENEMQTSKQQQEQLMRELQQERIEKGDLVAAVDEMLTLQSENGGGVQGTTAALSVVEDFRKSISRPSGLRAPGAGVASGQSRIGGLGAMSRSTSGGGKSRLLSNIERMGRTGGAGSVD
ncbi:hypothetical protein B0A55_07221 [Friedmanniomyces simplex]|uniref:DASH complex subunit DAD4 n=1 Tax=Friedmanniomyces simplex TaxID=329884 RepID=A0A4V5NFW7_9PEZI|nr:hypothetical protein B0A55_07221 [Friedmanniomyces simplex]